MSGSKLNLSVSSMHLIPVLQRLTKIGYLISDIFIKLELSNYGKKYTDLPKFLSVEQFLTAITIARSWSGDPLFCVKAGLDHSVNHSTTLAQLGYYSRDIEQILNLYVQYVPVYNQAFPVSLKYDEKGVDTPINLSIYTAEESSALMELRIASFMQMLRVASLRNTNEIVMEIKFAHKPKDSINKYEELLETKVLFEQPYNSFVVYHKALKYPIISHDPCALNNAINDTEELRMMSCDLSSEIERRVKVLIKEGLESSQYSLPEVADKLCMSVSTLKRHLRNEGTSYQNILDSARSDEILYWVKNSNLKFEEIAKNTGFSSASSFYQTVKRLFSCSPADLRK